MVPYLETNSNCLQLFRNCLQPLPVTTVQYLETGGSNAQEKNPNKNHVLKLELYYLIKLSEYCLLSCPHTAVR